MERRGKCEGEKKTEGVSREKFVKGHPKWRKSKGNESVHALREESQREDKQEEDNRRDNKRKIGETTDKRAKK